MTTAAEPRMTVLVVDDDRIIRSTITDVLEHAGYAVVVGQDAVEGLRLARERRPDVILLDLALPKRSGLDMLDDLKGSQETRSIPVILITAYAFLLRSSDVRLAASVIQKPFNVTDLLMQVNQAVSRQRGHERLAEPGA